MGRASRRPGLARAGPVALLAAALALIAATPARASGWTRPFRLGGATSLDVSPAQIAFAPDGTSAFSFAVQNEDRPAFSEAFIAMRSPSGQQIAPRRVPGAQQVLALAFSQQTLELLTGTSPPGYVCCTAVQTISYAAGSFGRARTVLGGLFGPALGELVTVPGGGLIAGVANQHGVWATHSFGGNAFTPARQLTPAGTIPQSLAATGLPGGRAALGWTATTLAPPYGAPRTINIAKGTPSQPPSRGRIALVRPVGYQIEQLALGSGSAGATAGWTESWFDSAGKYHSEAAIADLGPRTVKELAIPGATASDPSLAGSGGEQVFAWKTCTQADTCSVRVITRGPHTRFSAIRRLGRIDPAEEPVTAVGPNREALVGWIYDGRVNVAAHEAGAPRFAPARLLSPTRIASRLTVAFGPVGQAVATWVQGTQSPAIEGAMYQAP